MTLNAATGRGNPLSVNSAGGLHFHMVLDLCVEALRDQDLAGGRLIGQA